MEKLEIKGGRKISGAIEISGSKNATLPILASTILTNKKIPMLVLSSEKNALRLAEQINKGGMPSFVETFNEEKNLFAVYVGPFLSEDDILNNIDIIEKLSESNQGEVKSWKL